MKLRSKRILTEDIGGVLHKIPQLVEAPDKNDLATDGTDHIFLTVCFFTLNMKKTIGTRET